MGLREIQETREIIDAHFNSLDSIMLFLVQFVTVDGLADVYEPLVRYRGGLCIFFGFLIFVISIALMNLVIAKLVEVALSNAENDR